MDRISPKDTQQIAAHPSGTGSRALLATTKYSLYAVCFGFFLVLVDASALNVAIVAMQHEFSGTIGGLQWVVNSYTIVFASFLLTCGAMGDRFGAKFCYQVGLLLFLGMSVLCALSPSVAFLICARVVQGLGAALMLPASLSLLSHSFPDAAERGRAVAFWTSIVSLGFACGPALGGVLTTFFGWRSIFWLNAPVGLLALEMVRRFVAEAKIENPRHIDWLGQTVATLFLFCLIYGLIEAGSQGWTALPVTLSFAISFLLGAAFVILERVSRSPVLPQGLFSNALFSVCVATGGALNFGMYGVLFIESIYLQNVRGLGPFTAGLVILPFAVMPTISTRMVTKFSPRSPILLRLVVSLLTAASGAAILILALSSAAYWPTLLGLGLFGAGMGCVVMAITAGVLTSSPAHMSGLASGILNSSRQVGGAVGVALMGSLVQGSPQHGFLWSFCLTVAAFVVMAGVAVRVRPSSEPARPVPVSPPVNS